MRETEKRESKNGSEIQRETQKKQKQRNIQTTMGRERKEKPERKSKQLKSEITHYIHL